jgi:hypothetical protein
MKRLLSIVVIALACSEKRVEKTSAVNQAQEIISSSELKDKEEESSVTKKDKLPILSVLTARTVFDKVEVLVPRNFIVMDDEVLAIKYPLKQGTSFQVYTDEGATVNVAFEHTLERARPEELPAVKAFYEKLFNQPGIDFIGSEIRKIDGRDYLVIEMITPASDTRVYNKMFVTSSGGRLLMGTFNCTIDRQPEWQPIAEQIISSVRVKD